MQNDIFRLANPRKSQGASRNEFRAKNDRIRPIENQKDIACVPYTYDSRKETVNCTHVHMY